MKPSPTRDQELEMFLRVYLNAPNALGTLRRPGVDSLLVCDSFVAYKQLPATANFQVELISLIPGVYLTSAKHANPHVEQFIVEVSGCESWLKNDVKCLPCYQLDVEIFSGVSQCCRVFHVLPTDQITFIGGQARTYLSIQKWLTSHPTSIMLNWLGTPLSLGHQSLLAGLTGNVTDSPLYANRRTSDAVGGLNGRTTREETQGGTSQEEDRPCQGVRPRVLQTA